MEALFSDYEEIRKSGLFDAEYYLATYPEVTERNIDPLVHFLEEGGREGRNPHPGFDAAFYLEQCRLRGEEPDNPLLHYLRGGAARGLQIARDAPDRAALAMPDVAPLIRVAIEALGILGGPAGASRLSISGWALAAAPIAEISVALEGVSGGSAAYGLPRPDIARLHPGNLAAGHSGFALACELPDAARGSLDGVLAVRTVDGATGQHPLHVEIPPQSPGPSAAERPPMRLLIRHAFVDPAGLLQVEGAVVCAVEIEAVEAWLDGGRLGAAEFGRVRGEIDPADRDYPNAQFSGFRFVGDVAAIAPGRRTLTVRALARSGIAAEAAAPVVVPAPAPRQIPDVASRCHCDEIALSPGGRLALRGWTLGAAPTTDIRVLFDGAELGRAATGLERADIGNLFPLLPHARRPGFAFAAETGKPIRGEHIVTLRLLRAGGQVDDIHLPVLVGERGRGRRQSIDEFDRKLHLDSPEILDRATPVRGNLQIGGWAMARAGVAAIEIAIDDTPVAYADHGLRRLDIRTAYPDWDGSLASGFAAVIPHRLLAKGGHRVGVTLRDKGGGAARLEFAIAVEEMADAPGPWSLRREMGRAEVELGLRLVERAGKHPVFAAVLPVRDAAAWRRAGRTIASLVAQIYPRWRLFIVARGGATQEAVRDWLAADPPGAEGRVEVAGEAELPAILAAAGADVPAGGIFVSALGAGDELGVDAFLEMAIAAALRPEADFLYSDERCRNPASNLVEAFFKPQWSPDLMLSTNYVGRLWCARADLLQRVAAADPLLGRGEYDLLLRCTEGAAQIHHVASVLCERADAALDGPAQQKAALARALVRRGIAGDIVAGALPGRHRVKRALVDAGLVSIIIPTCAARGMIEKCITTLRRLTAYRDYEIICIENIAPAEREWRDWLGRNAERVIATEEDFNWSRFNNLAAAEARGKYLLFLNDDTEITDPDWLGALVAEAQRPEVGVVGARLLYPDGRVQHAGMFLAAIGQGRHAFRYKAEDDPGYFGLALTQRNVIAVTGACLMTRRATFEALGGFDEAQAIVNNDLDYCLRAWRSGLLNVYCPQASLVHHEAVSRGALADQYDAAAFDSEWRDLFLAGDPYLNPHLSRSQDDLAIDYEPTRLLVAGRPLPAREEIRRILVVKLDHIGDCLIAFPAVRRLKQHFPQARLTVLTSRASRPVWALEPSVDRTIEFDFFRPRSADGEIELAEADWRELEGRLAGEGFDLAIDLRKHTETRPVLRHTDARWLAGFDFRDQFPWLDVALEWTGDQIYARKRQHNGDDLVNLVDAVAASCDGNRGLIAAPLAPALPVAERPAAPLVYVHAGAGNEMKQWPVEYFAAVIDRLVKAHGARIVMIGGPDDEAVSAAILGRLRHRAAATSLVGAVPLDELPALLAGASLFLGNDSGPKHLAAGLGVPTVGVHAGSVDAREWGPVGPSAIAVARLTVCSPCYLSKIEDCRRGLVCLRALGPAQVYDACSRLLLLAGPAPSPTLPDTRAASPDAPRPPRRRARTRKTNAAAAAPPAGGA
ncbi:MAG TPA: glycosyltransferase family 9 protein [Stellaceae bacterium]|nr:glycosyltransferase family 9 protein [Stellaceae bacterium]